MVIYLSWKFQVDDLIVYGYGYLCEYQFGVCSSLEATFLLEYIIDMLSKNCVNFFSPK